MSNIHLLERAAEFALDAGHRLGATVIYLRDDEGQCMAFPRGDCADKSWLEPVRTALGFSPLQRDWLDFKREIGGGQERHLMTVGLTYDASDVRLDFPLETFA